MESRGLSDEIHPREMNEGVETIEREQHTTVHSESIIRVAFHSRAKRMSHSLGGTSPLGLVEPDVQRRVDSSVR